MHGMAEKASWASQIESSHLGFRFSKQRISGGEASRRPRHARSDQVLDYDRRGGMLPAGRVKTAIKGFQARVGEENLVMGDGGDA